MRREEKLKGKKIDSFSNLENSALATHYFHNSEGKVGDHYLNSSKRYNGDFDKGLDKLEKKSLKANFTPSSTPSFQFIDLFAGIGGFRMAMQNLGGKCIFTSEWDKDAKKTYATNYGEVPFGDITKGAIKDFIPPNFDVLCAGFPCQPFSKGGQRNGFEDTRGTLFFDLCEIIKKHQPKYLFLENVANLATHDKGNTYKTILKSLDRLGYYYPEAPLILSPDTFGVPILRPRIYMPCVRKDVAKGKPSKIKKFQKEIEKRFVENLISVDDILDPNIKSNLTDYENRVLTMWNDFYQGVDLNVIGFPVWMEFFKHKGSVEGFPRWKAKFIGKNVDLYNRNKSFIDGWLRKYENLDWCIKTHRKMEWQAGKNYASIFDCLIQFRPSGVRIKRPDKFATLVAMNHQQIVGKYRRRITIDESKRLQSFPENYILPSSNSVAMKQLGNSVNVKVVQTIFKTVLDLFE